MFAARERARRDATKTRDSLSLQTAINDDAGGGGVATSTNKIDGDNADFNRNNDVDNDDNDDDDDDDGTREPSPCEVQLTIIHATLAERRCFEFEFSNCCFDSFFFS